MNLELELPPQTLRKLRALAMLSGMTVDQIQAQLVNGIDAMLTAECAGYLGIEPGTALAAEHVTQPRVAVEEEEEEAPTASETDHALSQDEDTQENPSLAEEAEQVPAPKKKKSFADAEQAVNTNPITDPNATEGDQEEAVSGPFRINASFKKAGDDGGDADAFLDEALAAPPTGGKSAGTANTEFTYGGERASAAKKGGYQQARIRISDSGDDEKSTRWFAPN